MAAVLALQLFGKARLSGEPKTADEFVQRIARIAGEHLGEADAESALKRIESRLENMARVAGESIPFTFATLESHWSEMVGGLSVCAGQFDKIKTPGIEQAVHWRGASEFSEYFKRKCSVIAGKLARLDEVTSFFSKAGYQEDEIQDAMKEAASLLRSLQERFSADTPVLRFAAADLALSKFLSDLKGLVNPDTAREAGLSDNPQHALLAIQQDLSQGQTFKRDLDTLSEENRNLTAQLDTLTRVLEDFRIGNEDAPAVARRLAFAQNETLRLLDEKSGISTETLPERVSALLRVMRDIETHVRSVMPDAVEPIDTLVKKIVDMASENRQAQLALMTEVCSYLHLERNGLEQPDGLSRITDLLRCEARGPHRTLRLGLTASLAAFTDGIERIKQAQRQDIFGALRLDSILLGLDGLLSSMSNGNALDPEFRHGFEANWLHELFRAEALLDTYFAHSEACAALRSAVEQASWSLRLALQQFGYQVQHIDLLAANPPLSELVESKDAPAELRRIPEVRGRVRPYLDQDGTAVFVDIRSFAWSKDGVPQCDWKVVGINRADWRD